MWFRRRESRFTLLTAAIVIVILLVCLYPFRFAVRHGDSNAIGALAGSWATPPHRFDFILNIALYVPLGAFAALSSRRPRHPWRRAAIVTIFGTLLSIAIELAQYFDAARYTAATDVFANTLGTFLGAAAVVLFRR